MPSRYTKRPVGWVEEGALHPCLVTDASEFPPHALISGDDLGQLLIGAARSTSYGWLDVRNIATVPDGTYTLQSKAYAASGDSTYSSGVTRSTTSVVFYAQSPRLRLHKRAAPGFVAGGLAS